jgi:hypothetical protein
MTHNENEAVRRLVESAGDWSGLRKLIGINQLINYQPHTPDIGAQDRNEAVSVIESQMRSIQKLQARLLTEAADNGMLRSENTSLRAIAFILGAGFLWALAFLLAHVAGLW